MDAAAFEMFQTQFQKLSPDAQTLIISEKLLQLSVKTLLKLESTVPEFLAGAVKRPGKPKQIKDIWGQLVKRDFGLSRGPKIDRFLEQLEVIQPKMLANGTIIYWSKMRSFYFWSVFVTRHTLYNLITQTLLEDQTEGRHSKWTGRSIENERVYLSDKKGRYAYQYEQYIDVIVDRRLAVVKDANVLAKLNLIKKNKAHSFMSMLPVLVEDLKTVFIVQGSRSMNRAILFYALWYYETTDYMIHWINKDPKSAKVSLEEYRDYVFATVLPALPTYYFFDGSEVDDGYSGMFLGCSQCEAPSPEHQCENCGVAFCGTACWEESEHRCLIKIK